MIHNEAGLSHLLSDIRNLPEPTAYEPIDNTHVPEPMRTQISLAIDKAQREEVSDAKSRARTNLTEWVRSLDRRHPRTPPTRLPWDLDTLKCPTCETTGAKNLTYHEPVKPDYRDKDVGLGHGCPEDVTCDGCGAVVVEGRSYAEWDAELRGE